MSALAQAALQALVDELKAQPGLMTTQVRLIARGVDRGDSYPAVLIEPGAGRWQVEAWQRDEIRDAQGEYVPAASGRAVQIGYLTGQARLWCAAEVPMKRGFLEDAVVAAFNRDDVAPGRRLISVQDVPIEGAATTLDVVLAVVCDGEWSEELVFAERRWSFIDLDVEGPVLAIETDPLVDTMVAVITQDLETEVEADADVALLREHEDVSIDEGGAVSPWP